MSKSSRQSRSEIAQDTLCVLEEGYYRFVPNHENDANGDHQAIKIVSIAQQQAWAVEHTIVYSPRDNKVNGCKNLPTNPDTQRRPRKKTQVIVNNMTTLDAARFLGASSSSSTITRNRHRICCLNFASARNPGGGFTRGSQAQEESLARSSGLYPCLLTAQREFYDANSAVGAPFYTDTMIYSPNVPVFKLEDGTYMQEPLLVSFITAPAVNMREYQKQQQQKQAKRSRARGGTFDNHPAKTMKLRIAKILVIAASQQQQFWAENVSSDHSRENGSVSSQEEELGFWKPRVDDESLESEDDQEDNDAFAKEKIRSSSHKRFSLVLGAWGCGVFGNDPKEVSSWFRQALAPYLEENVFDTIVFAIYSPNDESPVRECFASEFRDYL